MFGVFLDFFIHPGIDSLQSWAWEGAEGSARRGGLDVPRPTWLRRCGREVRGLRLEARAVSGRIPKEEIHVRGGARPRRRTRGVRRRWRGGGRGGHWGRRGACERHDQLAFVAGT